MVADREDLQRLGQRVVHVVDQTGEDLRQHRRSVGERSRRVEQLLALKAGDFIELDLHQAIQAKVAGVPVLDCHYGTSNGKYALKVDQLVAGSREGWLGENNVH